MAELRTITRHAGTVLVGQLASMAFGVTDTLVAGRYSDAGLAALSIGSAIFISIFVGLSGVLQALLPVWAELHGGKHPLQLGQSVRQALYLCGACIGLGMVLLWFPDAPLRWTQVPEALREDARAYLAVLAFSLAPTLLFRLYATLNQSLGKPRLVTWLQIAALGLKIPLSIWFTFGGYGLDPGGAVGCAWATLVVTYAMLGLALWLLLTQELYRPLHLWRWPEPPDWLQLRAFARLGIPSGLAIMVEVTSFTVMALFVARLGTVASASHQIAANLAAILYMVPLSLGIATSARVSYWLGAGQPQRARHAMLIGLRSATGLALLLAALLWLARDGLAALYSNQPAVVAGASALLTWVALYHLADAPQAVCVFVLRSYRITLAPLLVYCLLLWGLGLGGGYVLAYQNLGGWTALQSPAAFWMASAVALAGASLVFAAMVWRAGTRPKGADKTPGADRTASPPLSR